MEIFLIRYPNTQSEQYINFVCIQKAFSLWQYYAQTLDAGWWQRSKKTEAEDLNMKKHLISQLQPNFCCWRCNSYPNPQYLWYLDYRLASLATYWIASCGITHHFCNVIWGETEHLLPSTWFACRSKFNSWLFQEGQKTPFWNPGELLLANADCSELEGPKDQSKRRYMFLIFLLTPV